MLPGSAHLLAGRAAAGTALLLTWGLGLALLAWLRADVAGALAAGAPFEDRLAAGSLLLLLTARFLSLPPRLNLGQQFDIELEVTNPGGSRVLGVKPEASTSVGSTVISCKSVCHNWPSPHW